MLQQQYEFIDTTWQGRTPFARKNVSGPEALITSKSVITIVTTPVPHFLLFTSFRTHSNPKHYPFSKY